LEEIYDSRLRSDSIFVATSKHSHAIIDN
jgi:hypothetical protein